MPQGFEEEIEDPGKTAAINVQVNAHFPDAEIFGIKLVNGKPTTISVSVSNHEPEPVSVQFVGGSLWTLDFESSPSRIVRNLTTKQYGVQVPPGESENLPYVFKTNLHPQELRLNLAAVVAKGNTFYTQQAFNSTVQILEPESSLFDPQMYDLPISDGMQANID